MGYGEDGYMRKGEDVTKEEVIAKYIEMFGGYPEFLLMGASDEEIIEALLPCIKSGEEYEAPFPEDDY